MLLIQFNDNNLTEIHSYGLQNNGDLLVSLYSNEYKKIKDIFFNSDKSHIIINDTIEEKSVEYENYIDITSFSSLTSPEMNVDYIQVRLKQHQPSIEELQARIAELEAKQAKYNNQNVDIKKDVIEDIEDIDESIEDDVEDNVIRDLDEDIDDISDVGDMGDVNVVKE